MPQSFKHTVSILLIFLLASFVVTVYKIGLHWFVVVPFLCIAVFTLISWYMWALYKHGTATCGNNCKKCCKRCPCRFAEESDENKPSWVKEKCTNCKDKPNS